MLSVIDREGIIGNGDVKGSMADASELSLADDLYERTGKNRGGPWETSSRFSLVAHHGTHSKLPNRNTPTISER